MASYSVEICNKLKEKFRAAKLHRPMRVGHYDAGTQLTYNIKSVIGSHDAAVTMEILKFVGGGFAGQVYRVKVLDIQNRSSAIDGIEKDGVYAMKILIPPSGFSLMFRNLMYRIGFQAPFQLQVNPTASRAGALWQKLIRKGAGIRFGNETAVNDIHATFVDDTLGSCGEISDWVDGRTWRLEVDDRMDLLKRFFKGKPVDKNALGSPEYRAKKKFMTDFVKLLQEMGAHEFARQYEWTTCKSQPNCLKLNTFDDDPEKGLTAVDFRAGLALLPFLPMSPGDIKLIFKGLARGSLVQFDRGNLKQLKTYMEQHPDVFADMEPLYRELCECEEVYRNSIPDVTHNFFRLFYSRKLWATLLSGTRTGWRVKKIIDHNTLEKLEKSFLKTAVFYFLGAVPILGTFIRKIWGRADMRKHYGAMFTSWDYLKRAFRAKSAETIIAWHRAGRVDETDAEKLSNSFFRFFIQLPFSFLPIGLYKCFTKLSYLKERLHYLLVRPVKLYFSASLREEWLREMVAEGRKKHILTDKDAETIELQMHEPYIQKYLKSLAVHVCTLPVTQLVALIVAIIYVLMNPQLTWPQAWGMGVAIMVLFQVIPVSPGSLARGLYVVYMMLKDRNFEDYNIAISLGFFKYIGYLAFPIQMTYRYPELARFMAGHWATEAVHVVPVFGEQGALLERWVFDLFYNWPLTLRMRMRKRAEAFAKLAPRYWHLLPYILLGTGAMLAGDYLYHHYKAVVPFLKQNWWAAVPVCLLFSALVVVGARGASFAKRFGLSAIWGLLTALLSVVARILFIYPADITTKDILTDGAWRLFIFTFVSVIWAIIVELRRPLREE